MPANFRTEEGMRRLLTAVIAAHDIKLNYKAVCKHYGSDWTESGIEHFFRPLKKNATSIRKMVERNEDAAEFNHNAFRQIKRDAEAMKQGKGGPGSTPAATPTTTPKSGRKRSAASAPSTGKSTAKKARGSIVKLENHVINLDDDDSEHSPIQTPTKTRRLNIDFDQEREGYARGGLDYDTGAPALSLAQSDSPNNDEDVKPITPGDSASYSFAQSSQQHTGADGYDAWNNNSFGAGNARLSTSLGNQQSYVADDYDDDDFSV